MHDFASALLRKATALTTRWQSVKLGLAGLFAKEVRSFPLAYDVTLRSVRPSPERSLPMLEISTLGGLRILLDGQPVGDLKSRRAEALLAYLACTQRPQSRDVLVGLLWDEGNDTQTRGNLRWLIAVLRQRLAPYLQVTRSSVALNLDGLASVDVSLMEQRLADAERAMVTKSGVLPSLALEALEAAVALYQGPFMHGFYLREASAFEEWALQEQIRLQRSVVRALDSLVTHYQAVDIAAPGIAHASRLLQLDPLREATHRDLMRLLVMGGNRSAALEQFEACRRTLAAELDVEPEPATKALYVQLRLVAEPVGVALSPAPVPPPLAISPAPTGTVTFLFSGIVSSARLWEEQPLAMPSAVECHAAILHSAVREHNGTVFQAVDGTLRAAFASAPQALQAAVAAQQAMLAPDQPGPVQVRASMALHTGSAELQEGAYFAPTTFNRLSRLLDSAGGGHILISETTANLLKDRLPIGTMLRDLGVHKLRDLRLAQHIFQVQAPGLPRGAPLQIAEERPNNLPAPATSFVARDAEVQSALALVRADDVRLVTFTGPGGTGKSRLSLQVARELLEDFPDGVWFVPLATTHDPALVGSAIAQALKIRESAGEPLLESLKSKLCPQQMLLTLDNFEQLTEAAPLLAQLLAAAPRLKLLVTSRTRLHIYGEHDFPVPPLALPNTDALPALPQLARVASIQLFVDRATAAKPDFALTSGNAHAVATVCTHLDGLPLAIELAATRIRTFSPDAMLKRIDSRLKLLSQGPHDLPPRHQTLRATIDWSYDLLTPSEQVVFGRLAVFTGGWTLDAAETVCNSADAAGQEPHAGSELLSNGVVDVMDALAALLDKSLIRQQDTGEGMPRFSMLETIREYAGERLAGSGEQEALRRRHVLYYLELAEAAMQGPGQERNTWIKELAIEHDNLRTALDWAVAYNVPVLAARLAFTLSRFWDLRGFWSEGRRRLHAVLGYQDQLPGTIRGLVLNSAAWLALRQSDTTQATHYLDQSLALFRELGDQYHVAATLNQIGSAALYAGQYERAQMLYEESLALMPDQEGKESVTYRANLATTALFKGNYNMAVTLAREVLSHELGKADDFLHAQACASLGVALLVQGDLAEAEATLVDGLTAARRGGYTLMMLYCLPGYAATIGFRGETSKAARLFGAIEAAHVSQEWTLPAGFQALYGQVLNHVRSQADASTWSAEFMQGQSLTLEAAVAQALEQAD